MADRKSPHAKILEFFNHSPFGEVELMFGLVKDIIVSRRGGKANSAKTVKSAGGKKRVLSPEARKRIADAQKKRWHKKEQGDAPQEEMGSVASVG